MSNVSSYLVFERLFVSLGLWLLSSPAIFFTVGPLAGAAIDHRTWSGEAHHDVSLIAFLVIASYAWASLLVMNIAWLARRRLPRWVPVAGTAAGASVLIFTAINSVSAAAFALPGLVLALKVCEYHFFHQPRS